MDFRDRLQTALGGTYTVEREIGGGGMSRVFVARETALGRSVVVKVLPPELAAEVSEERFRREVTLAAGLQHPHIVPLLNAGQADGLFYYTMPFVEGETLRSRLSREGELPVVEAVRILTQVSDALAYAHAHSIVHRDIKPENILLSGQHALVTDFGVAKALGDAADGSTLTATGLALGTAAYMAPEQVAGDPNVDHRADIYALGIVAYELLAGAPPFAGRTTQQLAAAHLTQQPEAVTRRRASAPAALASLVMRCLEKRPADRPQSADAVSRELAGIAISGGQAASTGHAPAKRHTVFAVAAGAVILAAVAGAFAVYAKRDSGLSVSGKRVVVAVLSNETGDTTLASFGKMAADWITQGLQETGFIDVVDLRTVLDASRTVSAGDAPVVEALATQTGAAIVVWGSYYNELDSLLVRAQIVDASDGKVLRTVSVGRISRQTPTVALEALRERVLAALAPLVDPRLATWETSLKPPSYAAYRAYTEGLETYVAQVTNLAYDSAAAHFADAVRIDSTFQTARLWQAFNLFLTGWTTNAGYLPRADSVIRVLQLHRDELSTADRRFYDWFLALRRGDMQGTYAAAREMMNASPGSAHATWETALAAVRTNRPREAIELFNKPALSRRPEGSLLLQGYWGWKANAFHLLEDYENELRTARLGSERAALARGLALNVARAHAGLGNEREALAAAQPLLESTSASSGPSLLPMRQIIEELQAHGKMDAARALADRTVDAYRAQQRSGEPGIFDRVMIVNILYGAGRFDELRAPLAELSALDSTAFPTVVTQMNVMGLRGVLAGRTNDRAAAGLISSELEAWKLDAVFRPLRSYWRARIAAVLGDRETAVALLRRAIAEGFMPLQAVAGRFLHADPDLGQLQTMPEFRELIRPRG